MFLQRGFYRYVWVVLFLFGGFPAYGQTVIFVDENGTCDGPREPTCDGQAWCTAFKQLPSPLSAIEVRVAGGTYTPSGPTESSTFALGQGVTLLGGFAGCGAPDPDLRDFILHQTILSGDFRGDDNETPVACTSNSTCVAAHGTGTSCDFEIGLCDLTTNNSWHVVTITTNSDMTIDGFTVTGGNDTLGEAGGGILMDTDTSPPIPPNPGVVIGNCRIVGNKTGLYGGGIALKGDAVALIVNCEISGNHADGEGGGLATFKKSSNDNAQARIFNCKIVNNTATIDGAGVAFDPSQEPEPPDEIVNTLIANNVATHNCGGVCGGRVTITNCTIVDNRSLDPTLTKPAFGGVCLGPSSSTATITNSILWGNIQPQTGLLGAQLNIETGVVTVRYSDVELGEVDVATGPFGVLIWGPGSIGFPVEPNDPLFVDPDGLDNVPGTADDDYRIQGVPLIDSANNEDVPPDEPDLNGDDDTAERVPLDLGWAPRFVDDPSIVDTGETAEGYPLVVDMGAHEFIPACTLETIASSFPPDGAIDARQPTELDGSLTPDLWDSVDIFFDSGNTALTVADFDVTVTGSEMRVITDVTPITGGVRVTLDAPLPPGEWTRFAHTCSGESVCLGFLPADVNNDRTSAPADILAVIDCLNFPPCEIWECDVDRSDECGPPDILRVIDLLNGVVEFDIWLDATLPANPCEGSPLTAGEDGRDAWAPVDLATEVQGFTDLVESFLAMVSTDEWTPGMDSARIVLVVNSVVDWIAVFLPMGERKVLADQLSDPSMVFPNPVVEAMIPDIIAALLPQ